MISDIWPYLHSEEERIEAVAKIAHAANVEYCRIQKQYEIPTWDQSSREIHESAMDGVRKILLNPSMTPEEAHHSWVEFKTKNGWVYAPGIRDYEKKTHPCLLPYSSLSHRERLKDVLFRNIVLSFLK